MGIVNSEVIDYMLMVGTLVQAQLANWVIFT